MNPVALSGARLVHLGIIGTESEFHIPGTWGMDEEELDDEN